MTKETKRAKKERAWAFYLRMHARYKNQDPHLYYYDPFSLTIAVLLSAQTTDAAVNKVTKELFRRWPTPQSMAKADVSDVAEVIRSIGFWRMKSKHCVEAAQMIVRDFGGQVPARMEDLTRLPGVGRKTANIVLNRGFHHAVGIAVDTHVFRIAKRLGFSDATTPLACEQDLLHLLPQECWTHVNDEWIRFGRDTCRAQRPLCTSCCARDLCPSYTDTDTKNAGKSKGSKITEAARSSKSNKSSARSNRVERSTSKKAKQN